MALSTDVVLASGLVAPSSYIRVTSVFAVSKSQASASVCFFAAADNPIAYQTLERTFAFELDGPNLFQQAYEHLKTLPEFADATDC